MGSSSIGQLTKSLAIEYAPYNIRVNCVCPGTIDTPLARKAIAQFSEKKNSSSEEIYNLLSNAQPIKRLGEPREVAHTISFICCEEAAFMTGSLIPIDGGFIAQ